MFSTTFIALKYIKSKKKPFLPSLSFLTSFLGIFLSIFTLVATISIMDGFKEEFERTIIGVRPHIKLYFPAFNQLQPEEIMDYKQKSQNLMQIQNINYANGGLSGEAMLKPEKGKGFSGVLFSALEIEDFLKRDALSNSIIKGDVSNFDNSESVIIGKSLALQFGLDVGSKITLISPNFKNTPFGAIPVHKTLKVQAIYSVGIHFYDSSYIFLPLKQGQKFLETKGVNFIEILLNNPHNIYNTELEIRNKFKNILFTDWKTENAGFIQAINLQKSVMFFILFMFLVLASFIVFSGLSSLVIQKNKTTAVLRTMGFSKKQVVFTFFQVGMLSAIPAIVFGLLFGAVFVLKLEVLKNWLEAALGVTIFDGAYYFLSYIPSKISFQVLFKIGLLGFILCFISIIVPSLRAIKTKPIESLKWE